MNQDRQSRLFNLASRFLKYFFLFLFGFAVAYVLSLSFGAANIAIFLLSSAIASVWRLGLLLFCLIATTVVVESLR
ncbi:MULTISPECIES: hypothetical protein [Nostocales]|nr:hypothetical protein [Tolypothrix bouteillei]